MKKVLVPLADGFEDIEAVSVIDVLRRGGVEVVTAAVGDGLDVRSAHGIPMRAERCLTDVLESEYDAIILPGGGEGTQNLKTCPPLLERLRRQKAEGRFVCAICAAPTVLEAAGTRTLSGIYNNPARTLPAMLAQLHGMDKEKLRMLREISRQFLLAAFRLKHVESSVELPTEAELTEASAEAGE